VTRDRSTAVAATVIALAFGSAIWQLPHVVRSDDHALRAASSSLIERDSAPADGFGLRQVATAARHVLPPDALYTIVVGSVPSPVDSLTALAVYSIVPDSLLPRRYTPDLHTAEWVITLHASSESLGVKVRREIGLTPDSNAVQVAP
jgi:hypothetical protein